MIPVYLSEIYELFGQRLCGEDKLITGVSTDSRSVGVTELFVPIVGEVHDAHKFIPGIKECGATLCEKECGETAFPQIRVDSTVKALGLIAKANAEKINRRVTVSLTGSVGKTTTKEMCALVLSSEYKTCKNVGNLNNHIGVPLTLLSLDKDCEALVCEMGMNHMGEISYLASLLKSDIAVITNVLYSHIENLGSRENIAKAKLEILEGLKPDGTLIINGDEPLLSGLDIPQRIIRVGMSDGCDVTADNIRTSSEGVVFDCTVLGERVEVKLPVPGRHNVQNAMTAIALGYASGIAPEKSAKALEGYVPAGMRQRIYNKRNTTVIADCYNAGFESMCAALESMRDMKGDHKSIAVLGDMLELGEMSEELHRRVGRKVAESEVDILFTLGDSARFILEEAKGVESCHFNNKETLARALESYIERDAIILFKASRGMSFEDIIGLCSLTQD